VAGTAARSNPHEAHKADSLMLRPGPHVRGVAPSLGSASDSGAARFVRYWLPVLVWATAIFIGSGDSLSSTNTSRFLEPLIHWSLPRLSHESVGAVMAVIRKCGHLTEYGVLAALCWRAVHQPSNGAVRDWNWRHAGIALTMAGLYAVSDEVHQAFVVSRTASPWDVALDACGAAAALVLIWGVRRLAKSTRAGTLTRPSEDVE
jgi:VanZ family protein